MVSDADYSGPIKINPAFGLPPRLSSRWHNQPFGLLDGKVKNQHTFAGYIRIESSQYMISTAISNFTLGGSYVDKRKFVYRVDGSIIDREFARDWDKEIPELGKSLSQLSRANELDIQHYPLTTDMTYQGVCDVTVYSPKRIGFLGDKEGVATISQYGEGSFPVWMHSDGQGFSVYTGPSPENFDDDEAYYELLDEQFTVSSDSGGVVVFDPSTPTDHRVTVAIPAGNYSVQIGWPDRVSAAEEWHHVVTLRLVGPGAPLQLSAASLVRTKPLFDSTMGYLLANAWEIHQKDPEQYKVYPIRDDGGESNLMDCLVNACGKASGWIAELVDYALLVGIFDYDHADKSDGVCLAQVILRSVLNKESDLSMCESVLHWLREQGLPLMRPDQQ